MLTKLAALLRRRWFDILCVLLHLAVLTGLPLTLVASVYADSFFNRGVTTSSRYDPIPFTTGNPMAINTFLNEEADPAVVERSLDMIADGGFGAIRQIFGWYEIEPQPGVFTDTNGRSTWEKYDRIVDLATERGIQIIARLEKPPPWSKANQPNPTIDGPPDRLSDYTNFVDLVVSRYRGKITFVQIWNEPNLEGEWGGKPIHPRGYVDLLEAGARAARSANPDVVVLLAGLAPTDQTGPANLSDLLFLEQVYELGGAPYFDIATVMVYGYGYSPYDRRVAFERNNYSRPIQTREIMERFGDEHTPVWAVEYGWVSLPDDWTGPPSPWGEPVSRARQAEYLVDGYLRAQREWPWMGVMAVWAFRFPLAPDDPTQIGNPTRGFAIVEHNFTPTPAFTKLASAAPYIQRDHPGSYALTSAQQHSVTRGDPLHLRIAGEGLKLVVQGAGRIEVTIDGAPLHPITIQGDGSRMRSVTVIDGARSVRHSVTIRAEPESSDGQPVLVGYVVSRSWVHAWIYPWIQGGLVAVFLGCVVSAYWNWRCITRRTTEDSELSSSTADYREAVDT